MDRKIGIILGIVTLLIFAGGIFLVSKSPQDTAYAVYDEATVQGEIRHQKGPNEAQVTIVEFADFQCPACQAAHPHIKALLEKYPENVRFVYRHFPLTQHKNAMIASQASEAAAKEGKFWEMYDLLYENQQEWENSDNPQELFVSYAKDLGLNTDEFTKALEEEIYKEIVEKDLTDGYQVDVDATPTFYVNNQKAIVSFDRLEEEVVSRLN